MSRPKLGHLPNIDGQVEHQVSGHGGDEQDIAQPPAPQRRPPGGGPPPDHLHQGHQADDPHTEGVGAHRQELGPHHQQPEQRVTPLQVNQAQHQGQQGGHGDQLIGEGGQIDQVHALVAEEEQPGGGRTDVPGDLALGVTGSHGADQLQEEGVDQQGGEQVQAHRGHEKWLKQAAAKIWDHLAQHQALEHPVGEAVVAAPDPTAILGVDPQPGQFVIDQHPEQEDHGHRDQQAHRRQQAAGQEPPKS